jgi:membrane protease YdiL (CAAX protease family)
MSRFVSVAASAGPALHGRWPAGPATAAEHGEHRASWRLHGLLGLLLVTLVASFVNGQDLFVFAYILIVSYAVGSHTRRGQPWSAIGIKHGFAADLRSVWPLTALDLVLQVLPPTLVVAFLLGYGPELGAHIIDRLPVAVGAGPLLPAVATLLLVMAPLTLVEDIVYRVVIQDGLSRSMGTPAAILAAALLFGVAHAVGTTGGTTLVVSDLVGVVLDGVIFGIIYARTHDLAVTWATHYLVDVVGLLALLMVL